MSGIFLSKRCFSFIVAFFFVFAVVTSASAGLRGYILIHGTKGNASIVEVFTHAVQQSQCPLPYAYNSSTGFCEYSPSPSCPSGGNYNETYGVCSSNYVLSYRCTTTGELYSTSSQCSGNCPQQMNCVQSDTPGLFAWGQNHYGKLGDGTTTHRYYPIQVKGEGGSGYLMGVVAAAGGNTHSLALKSDGTVWAWGNNSYGKLGDGTTTDKYTPIQVKGLGGSGYLTNIVAIAAGSYHSLALKSDGTVWAWGWNAFGQLGDGTTTDKYTPIQVKGPGGSGYLADIIAIAAGGFHSLALKSDGTVFAWGWNSYGQLGDKTTTQRLTPIQVKGPGGSGYLTGVVAIAGGGYHSIALKSDGTVWGWGYNTSGELGDGTTTYKTTPVQTLGPDGSGYLTNIARIAVGRDHGLALKSDGTVWAWGYNHSGQLGDNTTTDKLYPIQVKGPGGSGYLTGVVAVAAGSYQSFALKSDGTVWAWGDNTYGQLGDGTTIERHTPVQPRGVYGYGYLSGVSVLQGSSQFASHSFAVSLIYACPGNESVECTGSESGVPYCTVSSPCTEVQTCPSGYTYNPLLLLCVAEALYTCPGSGVYDSTTGKCWLKK